jgi:mRNA-degrading endonuclease RelE of RelBE toxin-antitoxin system
MKVYRVSFHEDVAIDYNEAYRWYESHQIGLGEQFLAAVREKLEQILVNPELYSVKSKPGYHETIINGFPYSIVYKIYKKQSRILVTSVHHQKKHPRKKYRK